MTKQAVTHIETTPQGIATALGALFIWGIFPFYFKLLGAYNHFEILAHRIIWTFILLTIFIVITKRFNWVEQFKKQPKLLLLTIISGLIISSNWLTYVWAVNHNQLLEVSLGYFMAPLVGTALSLVVLQERLRSLQWVAVIIATIAVSLQLILLNKIPWVSFGLAFSFSIYGIMQRKTPLMTIDGLFIETAFIVPIAIFWLSQAQVASSQIGFWFSSEIWLLTLAGPVTILPLLLFNRSTKMVAYSVLSFMGYLTPSIVFLLAKFYYHEHFDLQKMIVFSLIWVALLFFSVDLWHNRPSKKS